MPGIQKQASQPTSKGQSEPSAEKSSLRVDPTCGRSLSFRQYPRQCPSAFLRAGWTIRLSFSPAPHARIIAGGRGFLRIRTWAGFHSSLFTLPLVSLRVPGKLRGRAYAGSVCREEKSLEEPARGVRGICPLLLNETRGHRPPRGAEPPAWVPVSQEPDATGPSSQAAGEANEARFAALAG